MSLRSITLVIIPASPLPFWGVVLIMQDIAFCTGVLLEEK
jgi:hypothetical protein